MTRTLIFATAFFLAPVTCILHPHERAEARRLFSTQQQINQCAANKKNAMDTAYAIQAQNQKSLVKNATATRPDPVGDAIAAGKRAEWGIIRSQGMFGSSAIGVTCKDSIRNSSLFRTPTLGILGFSDVVGECQRDPIGCDNSNKIAVYAPVYNKTLVSLPNYPYRDFCQADATIDWPKPFDQHNDPYEYPPYAGFQPVETNSEPRTPHEAARRGNLAALEQYLTDAPNSLTQHDDYGVTPLGWAVAWNKPEAAFWLMDNIEHPFGDECQQLEENEQILTWALWRGNDDLAFSIENRTFTRYGNLGWSSNYLNAAATGGALRFLSYMLTEPEFFVPKVDKATSPKRDFTPESKKILDDYHAGLCWRGDLPTNAVIDIFSTYTITHKDDIDVGHYSVKLKPSSLPRVVVLSAHDSTIWHVDTGEDKNLKGIIALGIAWQKVEITGQDVPIIINVGLNSCINNGWKFFGAREPDELEGLQHVVKSMTGREVRTTISHRKEADIEF